MQEGNKGLKLLMDFYVSKLSDIKSPAKVVSLMQLIDKFTEIERENRLLLEKMTTIMTAKPHLAPCTFIYFVTL